MTIYPILIQSSVNWKSVLIGSRSFCLQRSSFKRKIYFGRFCLKNSVYSFFLSRENISDKFYQFAPFFYSYNNSFAWSQERNSESQRFFFFNDLVNLLILYYNFSLKNNSFYFNNISDSYILFNSLHFSFVFLGKNKTYSLLNFIFFRKRMEFSNNLKFLSYSVFRNMQFNFLFDTSNNYFSLCKILDFYYYFIFNKNYIWNFGFLKNLGSLVFFNPILKIVNINKPREFTSLNKNCYLEKGSKKNYKIYKFI